MADSLPPPPSLDAAEEIVRRRTAMRDRIEKQVAGVEAALAKDPSAARALSALASLVRQLRLAEHDVAVAEYHAFAFRQANPEDLSEEAYISELESAAVGMAEEHLRVFVDVWLDRHQLIAVAESEAARGRFDPVRPVPRGTPTQEDDDGEVA